MGKIKLLSLFSGIGAFEKALDRIEAEYEYFNTSHVYINHCGSYRMQRGHDISIHLMFILIDDERECVHREKKFQYISCLY